ncbi:unnamed protein product [Spodoptera exigua]|nr:unnamed protein product [Spodoptera exigua]
MTLTSDGKQSFPMKDLMIKDLGGDLDLETSVRSRTGHRLPSATIILVVIPEDVPAGLAAIYGFAPPLHKGMVCLQESDAPSRLTQSGTSPATVSAGLRTARTRPERTARSVPRAPQTANRPLQSGPYIGLMLSRGCGVYAMRHRHLGLKQEKERGGNDHRLGFGFRLGNHADFQILYEFGPQLVTKPLQTSRVRSTSYRQRFARRRPVFELLVRAGIIKRNYDYNVIKECDDEPR